jgi:hypothetical protein
MPGLEEVSLDLESVWQDGILVTLQERLEGELCTAPQHVTKFTKLCLDLEEFARLNALPTGLINLRQLELIVWEADAAALSQQLSVLSSLRHLDLSIYCDTEQAAAAAVSAVTNTQQLTYLGLFAGSARPPPSSWAAVLPCLTQLQVLALGKTLFMEQGLAAEVTKLARLQCMYVEEWEYGAWDLAAARAEMAPILHVLSKCNSLTAVLYSADLRNGLAPSLPGPVWEVVQEGGLVVSFWRKWEHASGQGCVVRPQACPHLPGVWELQQEDPADG